VTLGEQIIVERPLVALDAVAPAGLIGRAWDTIRLWMER
jgi:D-alanyl-D-alanine carboxypeptidase (penicillin-binding protein 5/6)